MGNPAWSTEQKSIVQALIDIGRDDFHIEDKTGVPRSTLRRWRVNLKKYGQIDAPIKANGRPLLLTDEALDGLLEYLSDSPDAYFEEMLWFLYDEYNIIVARSTLSAGLKRRGWNRKVMRMIARQRNPGLREDWTIRICGYKRDQFVFVDESACNKRTMDRKYGWAPVNEPTEGMSELERSKRWSLLPAYTWQGYMPGWLIHQGAVDGPMFIQWIKDKVLAHMQPYPLPHSVLVMDNASIHRNEEIQRACDAVGVKLEYLPPYSPDFNPVDTSFHDLKQWLRTHRFEAKLWNNFGEFLNYAVEQQEFDKRAKGHFSRAGIRR